MVLLVLLGSQDNLALLALRGHQESLPLCTGPEVVATAWRKFRFTCRVLGLEVFLAFLALKVHQDHRVRQAVTVDQFPTVGASPGSTSVLKFRSI